jgi:endonuclease/exonuclease/phosphatase family metal-dependent hydrolase
MVRLAADGADLVCLQELSVWALTRLASWSDMTAAADVARRTPAFTVELGRVLETLRPDLFRSGVTGQANAILVRAPLAVVEHRHVVLNPFDFRRREARRLGLPVAAQLHWAKERRVCQVLRVRRSDGTLVVANLHATGYRDRRLADAELMRAAVFVDGFARPDEPVLLCGDFNVTVGASRTLAELMTTEWGFSGATPKGIDHILVRGLDAGPPQVWPEQRRRRGEMLLSDHAPVEVEVA